jgi:putative pyruvate formate lyase activating enzyme
MDGLVDIYMPDFKFWDTATSRRLVKAGDYPEVAKATIKEMHRQVRNVDRPARQYFIVIGFVAFRVL